ncbi:hypothetical protein K504DRAFT_449180 [Pleomassaria siparia CBS 279.74]|uniref:Uncharacterized protein n=1 Tax=Pleomassaria siparia CBS 279.74 TaxID=1314801 RepID=A0A6G1JYA3_9PLEO|nr:hypothetical protein K504DRAFT_449180 [Pleomassaria siparia CBS 279.74]
MPVSTSPELGRGIHVGDASFTAAAPRSPAVGGTARSSFGEAHRLPRTPRTIGSTTSIHTTFQDPKNAVLHQTPPLAQTPTIAMSETTSGRSMENDFLPLVRIGLPTDSPRSPLLPFCVALPLTLFSLQATIYILRTRTCTSTGGLWILLEASAIFLLLLCVLEWALRRILESDALQNVNLFGGVVDVQGNEDKGPRVIGAWPEEDCRTEGGDGEVDGGEEVERVGTSTPTDVDTGPTADDEEKGDMDSNNDSTVNATLDQHSKRSLFSTPSQSTTWSTRRRRHSITAVPSRSLSTNPFRRTTSKVSPISGPRHISGPRRLRKTPPASKEQNARMDAWMADVEIFEQPPLDLLAFPDNAVLAALSNDGDSGGTAASIENWLEDIDADPPAVMWKDNLHDWDIDAPEYGDDEDWSETGDSGLGEEHVQDGWEWMEPRAETGHGDGGGKVEKRKGEEGEKCD